MAAKKEAEGSLRRGQVVMSYGPGATIDLPERSVIIGGLEYWRGAERTPISEPRLADKAARVLGVPRVDLYAPPVDDGDRGAPAVGIGVMEFPLWFVGDLERRSGEMRSRPLVHRNALEQGKFSYDGKKHAVTPMRFVAGCPNGHLSDIEWFEFTHGGRTSCRAQMWIDERGTGADLTDLVVRCECGVSRAMAQLKRPDVLGQCKGQRPWLGQGEKCGGGESPAQMFRLLVRTGSNAYYAQKLTVLSIPDRMDELRANVRRLWSSLKDIDSPGKAAVIRELLSDVRTAFATVDDAILHELIQAEREGRAPVRGDIKLDEFNALMLSAPSLGDDRPDGQFFARRQPLPTQRSWITQPLDRVVLVHRLREVTALVGFTRFEALVPNLAGEYDDQAMNLNVRRAPLAAEISWVPTVEVWGEGVFVAFSGEALAAWRARAAVQARQAQFTRAYAKSGGKGIAPDVTYVMLHTLAHLLITAVALDCGYNTGSLRERVYVTSQGAGILIYTASTDAEGTLGGLVLAARELERYLGLALEAGGLCSNDPICAQHAPDMPHEERWSLGAACHGCLLIAETSCERRNEYLDRSLVVGTVDDGAAAFFERDP